MLGRRTDGYHKLVTLMAPLALADMVRVEEATDFALVCDDPALATDDNLALRAARMLQVEAGERRAARITLTKRIPVAAGLGGGSSDAAATLVALAALWGTDISDAMLLRLGTRLGADVPFFLYGGAMTARGIGDVLTPAVMPITWLILVVPHVTIPRKTAALYGTLAETDYSAGRHVMQQVASLRQGGPLDPTLLDNAFLAPLERLAPVVRETREAIARIGAPVFLSGSGPTLAIPCTTEAEAATHAATFRAMLDATILVTRTQSP